MPSRQCSPGSADESPKPLLSVVMSADGSPHEGFDYPESAASALGLAAAARGLVAPRRRHGARASPSTRRRGRAVVDAAPDGWLDARAAHTLLDAYGIPLVPERSAASPDEAVAAARELGFPVVVKTAAARRAQDRERRCRARRAHRKRRARRGGADRRAGARAALRDRRRRAARGRRSGPRVRTARRLRSRRRARRAHRLGQLRARAADGRRRGGAADDGEGRHARRRLARGGPGRPHGARRSAAPPRAARRPTCRRSRSSISTRCSPAPRAASPSTCASASTARRVPAPPRPGERGAEAARERPRVRHPHHVPAAVRRNRRRHRRALRETHGARPNAVCEARCPGSARALPGALSVGSANREQGVP